MPYETQPPRGTEPYDWKAEQDFPAEGDKLEAVLDSSTDTATWVYRIVVIVFLLMIGIGVLFVAADAKSQADEREREERFDDFCLYSDIC